MRISLDLNDPGIAWQRFTMVAGPVVAVALALAPWLNLREMLLFSRQPSAKTEVGITPVTKAYLLEAPAKSTREAYARQWPSIVARSAMVRAGQHCRRHL